MSRLLAVALLVLAGCGRQEPPPKEYQLTGQILSIKPESQEVLVAHDDIPGFMMAMTMPYKVSDGTLLTDKTAGDLITATLVVGETTAYLSAMTKTGHAPVATPAVQPEISALDMVQVGDAVPDGTFLDQTGQSFTLSSYRGRRLALTFIYTRCPDVEFCPLMNQNFLSVQKAIVSTPGLADAQLLSITLDPQFDTPDVLAAHARQVQAQPEIWRFATGEPEGITAFARRLGLTVAHQEGPVLTHNLATAVIDAEGRLAALFSNNRWTPSDLVAALTSAAAARR